MANTAQGKAECCISLVLYLPQDLVQQEYMVILLICWLYVGGLLVLSSAIHCEELDSTLCECRIIA